jgi:1,4-alpha-glucan branching enzyme
VKGSLALLLHAHLPFVRHPEQEFCAEERWLFEGITESYVPLLQMMQRLRADGVPFRITLSVSPTLAAMLSDPLLRERYIAHLDGLIALTERECERNGANEHLLRLSQFYFEFFAETRRIFVEEWKCDLLAIVSRLSDDGALELIASAATHGILPILERSPPALRAQVAIGCEFFCETFGSEPAGFWLPECAYSPALDELLQSENIRWFVLDAHGLEHAQPSAKRGTFAPCFTPAGPAAFARDVEVSAQIWSAEHGYPGDFSYRDFYRDIGFDRTAEELAPLAHTHGGFTGIKYHCVTGHDVAKEFYVPEIAEKKARTHAHHFVELCLQKLKAANGETAVLVAPFDAELFGHWWFEGPIFLEDVIRTAAKEGLALIAPGDFLRKNPALQIVQPAKSSWGEGGFLDVWLDTKCGWIYPHLHAANERMIALANGNARNASLEKNRALRQLARELLLAQASDWPFHIHNGTASEYATERVRDHLARFNQLANQVEKQNFDTDFLVQCEERDNLLSKIEWRHFAVCHSERSRGISSVFPAKGSEMSPATAGKLFRSP